MTATNSRKPRDYRVLSACRKVIPHVLGVISAETENSGGGIWKIGLRVDNRSVLAPQARKLPQLPLPLKPSIHRNPSILCQVLNLYRPHLGLPNEVAIGL